MGGIKVDGFGRVVEQDGKAKYRVDMGGKITVYNHVLVQKGKEYVEQIY
jgi:hypothetical protein